MTYIGNFKNKKNMPSHITIFFVNHNFFMIYHNHNIDYTITYSIIDPFYDEIIIK
jgi:hypothetical protein